ncbi:hypothetical protein JCM1840_000040, partial [Sporobolomyces johnsonii]
LPIASPSEYSKPIRCPSCHAPLLATITPFCSSCSSLLRDIPNVFWRPSKTTHFDLFNLPKSYNVDQEKLKVEYSQLKEKLNPAEFVGQGERQWWAERWNDRVDSAYEVVHDDLSRALYLLEELFGVDLSQEGLSESLIYSDLATEIDEVADALDAATNAEELAAIRKTSSARFNETAASLSPAFDATLASDAHDIQPLCALVLRLQYLNNAVQYCIDADELSEEGDAWGWLYPDHLNFGRWHVLATPKTLK